MTRAELIAKKEAELKALREAPEATTPHESDCDVTVAMVCSNGSWEYLYDVMGCFTVQGIRLDMITMLDSTTNDPTKDIVPNLGPYMTAQPGKPVRNYVYHGEAPHRDRVDNTVAFARASMLQRIVTPYVWFADHDVWLWPNTLRHVLRAIEADDTIGALCVTYTYQNDHLEWGACMMRTEVAKKVGFDGRGRCGCVNLAKDLSAKGLRMCKMDGVEALHLKHGILHVLPIGGDDAIS